MNTPSNYKTLNGLMKATEKVCKIANTGAGKVSGTSPAMWLHNARFVAETKFDNLQAIVDITKRFSVTRPQDLLGGHSVFGVLLPTRNYIVGDNIPSVGEIQEEYNGQFKINNKWYSKLCFEAAA